MKISIVNGPNINLIGSRETQIYGDIDLTSFLHNLVEKNNKFEIDIFQSNVEGELINYLQNCKADGIIINAGGYTHTSVAIRDCILAINIPTIEVHLSNLLSRETFRHTSIIGSACRGSIMGLGLESYTLALNYFKNI
jgi:3-dehydroquinate dehydratase-2